MGGQEELEEQEEEHKRRSWLIGLVLVVIVGIRNGHQKENKSIKKWCIK